MASVSAPTLPTALRLRRRAPAPAVNTYRRGALLRGLGTLCLAALPGLLTLYLSFNSGGFFASATGVAVAVLAGSVALVAGLASRMFPQGGHRTLPLLGVAAAAFVVWRLIAVRGASGAPVHDVSLWPFAIGGAFFFYLWWLGALVFDLSFVWQRYVRSSVLRSHLATAAQPLAQASASRVVAPAPSSA